MTKQEETQICNQLKTKYPVLNNSKYLRVDKTFNVNRQNAIMDILTEQEDIDNFKKFLDLYYVRKPPKNKTKQNKTKPQDNVVLAINVNGGEDEKLKEENEKLKLILEKLTDETNKIITDLKIENGELRDKCMNHTPCQMEKKNNNIEFYVDLLKERGDEHIREQEKLKKEIKEKDELIQKQKTNITKFVKYFIKNKLPMPN
jgi:hypothetical protein